jgi:SAM-dependent methyltransferase
MIASYPLHRFREISHTAFIKLTHKRCAGYSMIRALLGGKCGLEFGGPSSIFSANHLIPIYSIAASIDNCNFAEKTLWTTDTGVCKFGPRLGKQLIMEASDPSGIADDSYDFVVASHVLEHLANPLRALMEWKRIVRPSGTVLLVLPHKPHTFDHRRPFTTFNHIQADFQANVSEEDLTHRNEIIALHDLDLDPAAGSLWHFQQRCLQNASNRAMHHHVFSPQVLAQMVIFLEMELVNLVVERPHHIIVLARKPRPHETTAVASDNTSFPGIETLGKETSRPGDSFHSTQNTLSQAPCGSESALGSYLR